MVAVHICLVVCEFSASSDICIPIASERASDTAIVKMPPKTASFEPVLVYSPIIKPIVVIIPEVAPKLKPVLIECFIVFIKPYSVISHKSQCPPPGVIAPDMPIVSPVNINNTESILIYSRLSRIVFLMNTDGSRCSVLAAFSTDTHCSSVRRTFIVFVYLTAFLGLPRFVIFDRLKILIYYQKPRKTTKNIPEISLLVKRF